MFVFDWELWRSRSPERLVRLDERVKHGPKTLIVSHLTSPCSIYSLKPAIPPPSRRIPSRRGSEFVLYLTSYLSTCSYHEKRFLRALFHIPILSLIRCAWNSKVLISRPLWAISSLWTITAHSQASRVHRSSGWSDRIHSKCWRSKDNDRYRASPNLHVFSKI